LTLPFSGKAFHIDDAFFIAVARNILAHPLRPYDGAMAMDDIDERVFRQHGETPTTFAALSHPPLVPYTIAALAALTGGLNERTQHLGFAGFALLATWAQLRLARRFTRADLPATLALVLCPAFVLGAQSLMTDVPALALSLAALAVFIAGVDEDDARRLLAAGLFAGLAIVTRYVAVALVPLGMAYVLMSPRPRRWRPAYALVTLGLVTGLWAAQNWIQHGAVHVLESARHYAQYYDRAPPTMALLARNALYDVAALGAVAFPAAVSFWCASTVRRALATVAGALAIAVAVRVAAPPGLRDLAAYSAGESAALVAAFTLGLVLVAEVVRKAGVGSRDDRFLALWFLGGLAGAIFVLPFGAVRYVLPLVPPLILIAASRPPGPGPGSGPGRVLAVRAARGAAAVLSVALSAADYGFAAVYKNTAARVEAIAAGRRVFFIADWGFRHYMEARGAQYLRSTDESPQPGDLVVRPRIAGLHDVAPRLRERLTLMETIEAPGRLPIRILSFSARAGFYSQHWGLLPFALSQEPLERFDVYRVSS
jgi:4-amino-4-deoxy-L-arabinose transferase-like glycosyltransferase